MKTNLQKILSISGQSGLFMFLTQTNSGVIVESLSTKKRSVFGSSAKVTSLSDIAIYTEDEEINLRVVFEKMRDHLSGATAPSGKSSPDILRRFFEEVLPRYDRDRFYTSHMKKVVEWYNTLNEFASLDFENTQEPSEEQSDGEN